MSKGFLTIGIVTVIGLFCSIIVTILQDPFFVYHAPLPEHYYSFTNEAYQNPGIAKNFDYTNIISGSSMTENFKTSCFDEKFGGKTVKLCYSGESLKNKHDILEYAFSSKKDGTIQNVFVCLDLWALVDKPDAVYNVSPNYLMDRNIFNDAGYLLNKDILINNTIPNLIKNSTEQPQEMDNAFTWYGVPYGDYAIFQQWNVPIPWQEEQEDSLYFTIAGENMKQNIFPILEGNPKTEFYFFYPPYSILYWYEKKCNGEVDALIAMKNYVNEQLLKYPNVHLYDFQWDMKIISNLWNYKDTVHFGENIQALIAEEFSYDNYKVNNYTLAHNNALKEFIKSFDIQDYGHEILWSINVLDDYLNYVLCNDKYRIYIAVNKDSSWHWPNTVNDIWKSIGSDVDMKEAHENAYLMIFENKKIQYERKSNSPIEYTSPHTSVYMKSVGGPIDGYASIIVDGVEYSQNSQGLNIVTYDLEKQKVVDSVCFDTCSGTPAKRMNGWR